MKKILSFIRNDIKNVRRDPLLVYLIVIPPFMMLLVRWLVPIITERLFSLVPYYPLILSLFFVLGTPAYFGMIAGFTLLDEKDENTLMALRVTPVPPWVYLTYRIASAVVLSIIYIIILVPATELISVYRVSLIPVSFLASLFAPLLMLFLAIFANNKVEGFALTKASGVFILAPIASYFIESKWQLLVGVMPTYWSFKSFIIATEGSGNYWSYIFVGFLFYLIILILLLKLFRERVY